MRVLKYLANKKLQHILHLSIREINNENIKQVKTFLNRFLFTLDQLRLFGVGGSINFDSLILSLEKCLLSVKSEFGIFHAKINSECFSRNVRCCRHMKEVYIQESIINIDGEVDFGKDLDYEITCLNFLDSGNKEYSNWGSNKDDITRIVKAIKNSGLSNSLKTLCLSRYSMSESDM